MNVLAFWQIDIFRYNGYFGAPISTLTSTCTFIFFPALQAVALSAGQTNNHAVIFDYCRTVTKRDHTGSVHRLAISGRLWHMVNIVQNGAKNRH